MKKSRLRAAATFRAMAVFMMFLFISSFILSCATGGSENSVVDTPVEIPDELSLRADREAMADDRREIPESKRKENDEIAMIFQLITAKSDQEPSEIRNRFNTALRKKRELNDKNLRQRREDFTKNERRSREDFLKKMKEDRDEFTSGKHNPDQRKRFFDSQDERRKEFFANEADKRKDFESKMTEDRKTFEDYAREKTNQFNDEMRAYTADLQERRKQLAIKKRADEKAKSLKRETDSASLGSPSGRARPGARQLQEDEFNSIPKGPSIQLGTPSGH